MFYTTTRFIYVPLRFGRSSGGTPPTRCSDDLIMVSGKWWMRMAKTRSIWQTLGEAYTSSGCLDGSDDDDDIPLQVTSFSERECFSHSRASPVWIRNCTHLCESLRLQDFWVCLVKLTSSHSKLREMSLRGYRLNHYDTTNLIIAHWAEWRIWWWMLLLCTKMSFYP